MAREASIQSIPARFETTGATAAAIGSIFTYGFPLNYYATLPDKYREVTPEAVEKAAKTEVHPDHLIIVAVGDKSKIEAGLKDAKIAPMEYADPSGNHIP